MPLVALAVLLMCMFPHTSTGYKGAAVPTPMLPNRPWLTMILPGWPLNVANSMLPLLFSRRGPCLPSDRSVLTPLSEKSNVGFLGSVITSPAGESRSY